MELMEKPGRIAQLKQFLKECLRVLKVTKKPDPAEFKMIIKASGLGITVIGMIGFIISLAKQLLIKP